jgi:hypothetical protein
MREFTSKTDGQADEATVLLAPVAFTLDGVKFEAQATVSVLDLGWLYQFEEIDADSLEGMAALTKFLSLVLGREVYERLARHIRKHNTSGDTLMEIVEHIVESVTERPTEAPSTSPPSTAQTAPGSTEPSSPPDTEPVVRRVSLAGAAS